jgi:hypothetical protein
MKEDKAIHCPSDETLLFTKQIIRNFDNKLNNIIKIQNEILEEIKSIKINRCTEHELKTLKEVHIERSSKFRFFKKLKTV